MKTKIIGEGGGGLINFLPLKRGGLLEGGGLFEGGGGPIEDLRYFTFKTTTPTCHFGLFLVIALCLGLVVDSDISNFQYLV